MMEHLAWYQKCLPVFQGKAYLLLIALLAGAMEIMRGKEAHVAKSGSVLLCPVGPGG